MYALGYPSDIIINKHRLSQKFKGMHLIFEMLTLFVSIGSLNLSIGT